MTKHLAWWWSGPVRRFWWWWWPTIGLTAIVVFFAWVTFDQISHHRSATTAVMVNALFLWLLLREVRRTRREIDRLNARMNGE